MFRHNYIGKIRVQNASYINIACVAVLFYYFEYIQSISAALTTSNSHLRKHLCCNIQLLLNSARLFPWVEGQRGRSLSPCFNFDEKP